MDTIADQFYTRVQEDILDVNIISVNNIKRQVCSLEHVFKTNRLRYSLRIHCSLLINHVFMT